MKFLYKIQKFMYGRYAKCDELYKFLFLIYIFLLIIDLFVNSIILIYLQLILFYLLIYRFLSKNIYKRTIENKKFIKIKNEFIKPFINFRRNISDKNHVYKKCSNCKTTLKLPVPFTRGIKHAKCPECGKKIQILVLKKVKVEIIKN